MTKTTEHGATQLKQKKMYDEATGLPRFSRMMNESQPIHQNRGLGGSFGCRANASHRPKEKLQVQQNHRVRNEPGDLVVERHKN